MITRQQLLQIMPHAGKRVDQFLDPLNQAMDHYQITTPPRVAMFLAQLAHESGELRWVEELASGKAYDTGKLAQRLGNTPAEDGDGQKFKGHGLIQITGHDNHLACSLALFGDDRLLQNPRLLCEPQWAAMSAGWFWDSRGLNTQADKNDLEGCTRRINGGLNGYAERLSYYEDAKFALM